MICLWNWKTLLLFILMIPYFLNIFRDNFWFFLRNFVNYWNVTVYFVPQVFNFKHAIVSLIRFIKIKFFNRSINNRFLNLPFGLSRLLLSRNAFMWFSYWLFKYLGFDFTDLYFLLYFFWLLNLNLLVFITQFDCFFNVLLNSECSLGKFIKNILGNHQQLIFKSCIKI